MCHQKYVHHAASFLEPMGVISVAVLKQASMELEAWLHGAGVGLDFGWENVLVMWASHFFEIKASCGKQIVSKKGRKKWHQFFGFNFCFFFKKLRFWNAVKIPAMSVKESRIQSIRFNYREECDGCACGEFHIHCPSRWCASCLSQCLLERIDFGQVLIGPEKLVFTPFEKKSGLQCSTIKHQDPEGPKKDPAIVRPTLVT